MTNKNYFVKLLYFQYSEDKKERIGFSTAKAEAAYEEEIENSLGSDIEVNSIGCSINIENINNIKTNFAEFINKIKEQ